MDSGISGKRRSTARQNLIKDEACPAAWPMTLLAILLHAFFPAVASFRNCLKFAGRYCRSDSGSAEPRTTEFLFGEPWHRSAMPPLFLKAVRAYCRLQHRIEWSFREGKANSPALARTGIKCGTLDFHGLPGHGAKYSGQSKFMPPKVRRYAAAI